MSTALGPQPGPSLFVASYVQYLIMNTLRLNTFQACQRIIKVNINSG